MDTYVCSADCEFEAESFEDATRQAEGWVLDPMRMGIIWRVTNTRTSESRTIDYDNVAEEES